MNISDSVFKESILSILQSNPDGVDQSGFQKANTEIPVEKLCNILSTLTTQGIIEALQTKNKHNIWKLKSTDICQKEKTLNVDESKINKEIRKSGCNGISRNQLKKNMSMKETEMVKIERRLIDAGLIKMYHFSKAKVFVASDFTPPERYIENCFGNEDVRNNEIKITNYRNNILEFLKAKYNRAAEDHSRISEQNRAASVSIKDIHGHIMRTGIQKVTKDDIRPILDSLVNSGDLIMVDQLPSVKIQAGNDYELNSLCYRYRPSQRIVTKTFATLPCILCTHREYCSPGNEISPENCNYMSEYMNQF